MEEFSIRSLRVVSGKSVLDKRIPRELYVAG